MAVSSEERKRILKMVASGQVSVDEAAQLFDVLLEEAIVHVPQTQHRTIRVWVTNLTTRGRQAHLTATLPVDVLSSVLHMLAGAVPVLRDGRVEQLLYSLEKGVTGRIMDLQDLEDGKRVEIFLEQ